MRLASIVGCLLCGTHRNVSEEEMRCRDCIAEYNPTPLRTWREFMGVKLATFVEETGLTRRTVIRAERGDRMSRDVAEILAKHTGLPWRTFRPKKERTR